MRRLHDPLHRAVAPPRYRLGGPTHQRALTIIAERPGLTVAELRDALGVSSVRVWQIVGKLEYVGVLYRDGAPARRLKMPRQSRPPA
jgi:DNA-binding MarR family transcriptional regulator